MKGLTDIPGFRVGHVSDFDAITGCTAILCEQGAVAGVDIRGSASGTQETPTLDPGHVTSRIHGILLAGGSAFGLEAASGVRRYLEHRGVGFDTGAAKVPIVPAAILYDLGIGKADVRPDSGDGRSGRRRSHGRRREGRLRGRGHRRHRRQDSGHGQRHEIGDRFVHRHACRTA